MEMRGSNGMWGLGKTFRFPYLIIGETASLRSHGSSSVPKGRHQQANAHTLIIACGAIVREIQAVLAANHMHGFDIRAVPATYHNRPEKIAGGVKRLLDRAEGRFSQVFVAYADCGTGGALDQLLDARGVVRLPGAHCYAFYSGVEAFTARGDADMRAFFLTDFLARHFEVLVIRGLGLDRHPELRDAYFGNYERVVYLSQAPDADLLARAEAAAERLGLAFEHRPVGYGDLATGIAGLDRKGATGTSVTGSKS